MDHLREAKRYANSAIGVSIEFAPLQAQIAIAHALIALVERMDTPKTRIDPADWALAMDEVAERVAVGDTPYRCGICHREECSH